MKKAIKAMFQKYEYGSREGKDGVYRRNLKTGEIQFILWKAGQHNHNVEFWHRIDPTYWNEFKPYNEVR